MISFLRLSFLLSLVFIEKIYQTLKTLLNHISTHLEARKNYSATRRVFSYLLGVS